MKNTAIALFSFGALLLLSGAGCAQNIESNDLDTGDTEETIQTNDETTMEVPAPDRQSVDQMIIGENDEEVMEDEKEAVNNSPVPSTKTITITAEQWKFIPSTITVKQGDLVKLLITSTDVKHGFSLSAFDVNVNLNPGETTVVEFGASKTGTFAFSCSVFCGSGHAHMSGTLIVE